MKNSFKVGNRFMNVFQFRKYRDAKIYELSIKCPYCVTKSPRHHTGCATLEKDFNPETAHKLTKEERDKMIEQRNAPKNMQIKTPVENKELKTQENDTPNIEKSGEEIHQD